MKIKADWQGEAGWESETFLESWSEWKDQVKKERRYIPTHLGIKSSFRSKQGHRIYKTLAMYNMSCKWPASLNQSAVCWNFSTYLPNWSERPTLDQEEPRQNFNKLYPTFPDQPWRVIRQLNMAQNIPVEQKQRCIFGKCPNSSKRKKLNEIMWNLKFKIGIKTEKLKILIFPFPCV